MWEHAIWLSSHRFIFVDLQKLKWKASKLAKKEIESLEVNERVYVYVAWILICVLFYTFLFFCLFILIPSSYHCCFVFYFCCRNSSLYWAAPLSLLLIYALHRLYVIVFLFKLVVNLLMLQFFKFIFHSRSSLCTRVSILWINLHSICIHQRFFVFF